MSASSLQTALNVLLNKLRLRTHGQRGMVAQTHFKQKFDHLSRNLTLQIIVFKN